MTEECKCCKEVKELTKKVLIIALGTAIGVYGGLSLFAATHKPPKHAFSHMKRPPFEQRTDFHKIPQHDWQKIKLERNDTPFVKKDIKKVGN